MKSQRKDAMPSLFQLQNVSKRYRQGREDVPVFADVSLTIDEGDFIALMGPSGSGKTTMLHLLGGIDKVTSGNVRFREENLQEYSDAQLARWRSRHVGFVFQSYNLMPMLSAAQNVELPLLLTSLNRRERARHVQSALELVGLADRARHLPRQMSGGQQQRVAIARALVSDPALLLCDEPTGNLDRQKADEVLAILQMLNRDHGKTIVMVTHDPAAAAFARRSLHLDKGRFVEQASMQAVASHEEGVGVV
jgi:putative ABC transport system ATP-binding protein